MCCSLDVHTPCLALVGREVCLPAHCSWQYILPSLAQYWFLGSFIILLDSCHLVSELLGLLLIKRCDRKFWLLAVGTEWYRDVGGLKLESEVVLVGIQSIGQAIWKSVTSAGS